MSSEPALVPAISSGFESLERGKGGKGRGVGRGGWEGEGWEEEEQEGTKRACGGGV